MNYYCTYQLAGTNYFKVNVLKSVFSVNTVLVSNMISLLSEKRVGIQYL
jgi:hypothetical protein